MSHTEQMREAFERHMSDGGKFPKAVERSGDGYRLLQTQNAWDAWKACAAAIIAKTTTENTPKGMLSTTCPWCESGFAFEAPALTAPAAEVPEAMGDDLIRACNGESPFIARRTLDKSGYEVVENTHPDWLNCIPNSGWRHHGYFGSHDEADDHKKRLHATWLSTRLRGGVPEGWKLVPVEPTREMIQAACDKHGYPGGSRWVYRDGYRTMLTAAPQAPAAALDAGVVRDADVRACRRIAANLDHACLVEPYTAARLLREYAAVLDRAAMSAQAGKGGA